MKLFQWLFSWKKKKNKDNDSGTDEGKPVYDHASVNFYDDVERKRYITGCLEQILTASKGSSALTREYQRVTSELKDMEEIETLPEKEMENLRDIARHIEGAEACRQDYIKKKNRMPDARYRQLEQLENEVVDGIREMEEAEKYRKLVKGDLARLDGERSAYAYRRTELKNIQENLRGLTGISLGTLLVCVLMLLVLQFLFKMDVLIGYFITFAAFAIVLTVLYYKYSSAGKTLLQVEKSINRLIQLQNTVKIRFVNNTNLMDYLYLKYDVKNAAELKGYWDNFQEEKAERKQYEKTEEDREYYRDKLVRTLQRFRVTDPEKWIYQTRAILDKREMVEIRHELIQQRQALRKQLDYNREIAENAQKEVREVAALYPAYAAEITGLVEEYEKQQPGE